MAECKRPTCSRLEHVGHRGFCSQHFRQDQKERAARGEWIPGRVPAGPTIDHVDKLLAAGWTLVRLANATGLTHSFYSHFRSKTTIRAYTEARILAVKPNDCGQLAHSSPGSGRRVPSVGTIRRIRALRAVGYTVEQIARESGLNRSNLKMICINEQPTVFIETAHAVAEAFKRLEMTPAPASRAASRGRNYARKRGWPAPLAWDEDSIDDPSAGPHIPIAPPPAWFDDYQELKSLGFTDTLIVERMGIRRDWLVTKIRRMNETSDRDQEH